jgi:hypothetical protein
VCLLLNEIGQEFPAGNRLRLSLSTSYWPLAWAPPAPVRLTISTSACQLVLPRRLPRDADVRPFAVPECAPELPRTLIEPEHHSWRVVRDLASDTATLEVINDRGCFRLDEHGLVVRNSIANQFELPVLFHVCCVLLYIVDADNLASVSLAWLFVALRYAHAFIHVTSNSLRHRGPLFLASFVTLATMWAWLSIWMAMS